MTIRRINYVQNPSYRDGTLNYWTSVGAGATVTIAQLAEVGTYSARIAKVTGVANCGIATAGYRIPVTAGLDYTFSTHVNYPNVEDSRTYRVQISWYTAGVGGTLVNSSYEDYEVLGVDGYTPISVTDTAPDGGIFAQLSITQVEAETANLALPETSDSLKYFYVDASMFEQSLYVNAFTETISQESENAIVLQANSPVAYPNITGLELNADITLNGLIFNTIDEDGVIWICNDLDGWWGHPDPEVADITRGLGDGSYDVRGRYAARQITFSGAFYPPSRDYVQSSRDKLVRAIDLVKKAGWLLADEEPTKAASVRLVGRPSITTTTARGKTEFEFDLRAPDPIKYEWVYGSEFGRKLKVVAKDATEFVVNDGNTNVPVVLEVHGPLKVDSIIANTSTDQSITLLEPLRGTSSLANVTYTTRANNVATLELSANPGIFVGDYITVAGVTGFNGTDLYVKGVSNNADTGVYSVSYDNTGSAVTRVSVTAGGTVSLTTEDILEIDTYSQEVALNGLTTGYRFYINTLADWIYLQPGSNSITFDAASPAVGDAPFLNVYYRSGWIG